MSKHLFGIIATPYGAAANNRGENDGNITTLQKVLWQGEVHTTVSAEAIRWAIRYFWQQVNKDSVNRVWDSLKNDHVWQDKKWLGWNPDVAGGVVYIDDDVLGYMDAMAASRENDAAYAIPLRQRELREALEEAEDEGDNKKLTQAKKKQDDFEKNKEKLEYKWQKLSALTQEDGDAAKESAKEIEK